MQRTNTSLSKSDTISLGVGYVTLSSMACLKAGVPLYRSTSLELFVDMEYISSCGVVITQTHVQAMSLNILHSYEKSIKSIKKLTLAFRTMNHPKPIDLKSLIQNKCSFVIGHHTLICIASKCIFGSFGNGLPGGLSSCKARKIITVRKKAFDSLEVLSSSNSFDTLSTIKHSRALRSMSTHSVPEHKLLLYLKNVGV